MVDKNKDDESDDEDPMWKEDSGIGDPLRSYLSSPPRTSHAIQTRFCSSWKKILKNANAYNYVIHRIDIVFEDHEYLLAMPCPLRQVNLLLTFTKRGRLEPLWRRERNNHEMRMFKLAVPQKGIKSLSSTRAQIPCFFLRALLGFRCWDLLFSSTCHCSSKKKGKKRKEKWSVSKTIL